MPVLPKLTVLTVPDFDFAVANHGTIAERHPGHRAPSIVLAVAARKGEVVKRGRAHHAAGPARIDTERVEVPLHRDIPHLVVGADSHDPQAPCWRARLREHLGLHPAV